ncbi:MAG: hypothetical protein NC485_04225 [Ruminococcus flavefaciens]|nr:hypothetical protein [Ruminococcus flavefaciens]MCM1058944.1 hypothetical protein [Eubacterium sp.]
MGLGEGVLIVLTAIVIFIIAGFISGIFIVKFVSDIRDKIAENRRNLRK